LKRRLDRSATHVTADPSVVGTDLTLRVLVTTLRRMPGTVCLDPQGLSDQLVRGLQEAGRKIDSSHGIVLASTPPDGAVHVHVGTESAQPMAIRVVPDGYGAHVARDPAVRIHVARPARPLGAVYAAALGAAEAFKDIAGVRDERRVDHAHLAWCPVALSADLTLAPIRAGTLHLDLALAGCGAIGTAIAVILAELDAEGSILLVDRQRFARENVATYSVGDERNARGRPWKVNLVGRHLRRFSVRRFHGDVAMLPAAVDTGELPWPRLVLAGLDSIPARHDLQRLWPDRLVDAGVSMTWWAGRAPASCASCLREPRSPQPFAWPPRRA
jgi:hypothetical protein